VAPKKKYVITILESKCHHVFILPSVFTPGLGDHVDHQEVQCQLPASRWRCVGDPQKGSSGDSSRALQVMLDDEPRTVSPKARPPTPSRCIRRSTRCGRRDTAGLRSRTQVKRTAGDRATARPSRAEATSPEPRWRHRVMGSEADVEARRPEIGTDGCARVDVKGAPGGDDARASCGDDGGCEGDSEATAKGRAAVALRAQGGHERRLRSRASGNSKEMEAG
jgi:hypothetical protein